MKKIGILVGREESWLSAFLQEINRRNDGVLAELIKLGGTRLEEPCEYQVIVDRISHQIPYYRAFLKSAMLKGTTVINNPFWSSAIDGFFGASLATRLGINHPRTVALPSHSYQHGVTQDSLRNLVYPIPWQEHIASLGGFPTILRPIWSSSSGRVWKVMSYEELWRAYNETGTECMMLQEHIAGEKHIRCFCVGQQTMSIGYNPYAEWSLRYLPNTFHLSDDEHQLIDISARKINEVLGYDISAIDFVIKENTSLYLMDIMNPAPDFDRFTLPMSLFDWLVATMADFTIALAQGQQHPLDEFRWKKLVGQPEPEEKPAEKKPTRKRTTSKKTKASSEPGGPGEQSAPPDTAPREQPIEEPAPEQMASPPRKTSRSRKKTAE